MTQTNHIIIYTDGSALGNPGPGGYGIVLKHAGHIKELSGGFRRTTNNRMEILAAVMALKALKRPSRVTLYSDSQYLTNAINKGWAKRWRANEIEFVWLRGHTGNPDNERCDQLAKQAAQQTNLPPDRAYENPVKAQPGLFTQ